MFGLCPEFLRQNATNPTNYSNYSNYSNYWPRPFRQRRFSVRGFGFRLEPWDLPGNSMHWNRKKKVTLVQFPLRHGTVNGSKVWPIYIYNIIYGQKEWIFINHHFCWCFYWRYPILVPIFSCISKFPGGWLKWPPLDCIFCCSNRLKPPSFNIKPSSKLNHHVRFPPKMVAIWI